MTTPEPETYTDHQIRNFKRGVSIVVGIIIALWVIMLMFGHEHENLIGTKCRHTHGISPIAVIDGHRHGIYDKDNCLLNDTNRPRPRLEDLMPTARSISPTVRN